jgi:hypothetical protein
MQPQRLSKLFGSFLLAAIAGCALTINASRDTGHPTRLGLLLLGLISLHLLRYRWLALSRESTLYLLFIVYMIVSLLWTDDLAVALDALPLPMNFLLIAILFGALATYHDVGAVLAGTLLGFLFGAAFYTVTAGFPFVYPDSMSYNAIAGMYLFGLFVTALFGWHTRRTLLCILLGAILLLHIAATTSIKTNLGVLIGVTGASLIYFKVFVGFLRRYSIACVALVGMIAYAVISNDALVERVQAGLTRVSTGVQILRAREDVTGATEFGARGDWKDEGLKGWRRNPLFGNGVEAFRADYGVTSHSTPVDLLYNSGLIGLVLFYATLASIAWRLFRARDVKLRSLPALIFAGLVCYLFISLSGAMYYDYFLAAFIGISTALLGKLRRQPEVSQQNDEVVVAAG